MGMLAPLPLQQYNRGMSANDPRLSAYQRHAMPRPSAKKSEPLSAGQGTALLGETGSLSDAESRIAAGLLKVPKKRSGEDSQIKTENNYRRVAKFLLLIGTDEAAKVISHFTPEQTERIVPEIASIRSVDPEEAAVIMAEFQTLLHRSREGGGVETARTILEKAYGTKMADEMLKKAVPFAEGVPFEYMQDMDGKRVHFLLQDETAAVRALVLSRLKPALAAEAIKCMPMDEQKETIYRLAKLAPVAPDMLRRIDRAMHEKVLATNTSDADQIDGRAALSEILKRMSLDAEQEILDALGEKDPELRNDIRDRLFTMEDLDGADDRFLQELLHSMTNADIAVLIAGKQLSFREKILRNISKGRGVTILEEEKLRSPVLKKDSDRVTTAFFAALRRAWEEGKLILRNRDDIYV